MIKISSYLKINNSFINIQDYHGKIDDEFYIDGAIELLINNIELTNKSMWDYIDQLWCYFIDGLNSLSKNECFKTNFPDQSIVINLEIIKNNILITIGENKAFINKDVFIANMAIHAKKFFTKLITLDGVDSAPYTPYLNDIEILIKKHHNINMLQ